MCRLAACQGWRLQYVGGIPLLELGLFNSAAGPVHVVDPYQRMKRLVPLNVGYAHRSELSIDWRGTTVPIAICVPARDEATALPKLFAALEQMVRSDVAPRLCLLLDSCTDASVAVARDYAVNASLPVFVEQVSDLAPNAGRARHQAMVLGERCLNGAGVLLTTDADSTPAADWLQTMVSALHHADVVAGKVIRKVTRSNPVQDRLEAYYDALYAFRRTLDPVAWDATNTHHHSSGANLGLFVESYRSLGGFMALASGEDALLIDDAARAGLHVRRDAASVVYTSDRRFGRVTDGLAGSLRALDRNGEIVEVTHPGDAAWQYSFHAIARSSFESGDFSKLAAGVELAIDHIRGVARDCPNGEAFAMRVVPTVPGGMRCVSLGVAEVELATLIAGRLAA
ncbi:glycosyltransferase [Sphingomonas sp. Y38-1Y]|uniref:glycosyltransferase n=1 Tax=Sphingomonas sp. Y38-1Y TaxID=3078265 RepID=UPI0028F0948E|nr:glycosyltransferase [Sphingomonas sp. Y38-1Y]